MYITACTTHVKNIICQHTPVVALWGGRNQFPIMASRNFKNFFPCNYFVMESLIISSVGQYITIIFTLFTRSAMKKY